METWQLWIAILGVVVTIIALYKQFYEKPKKEKNTLLAFFSATQLLSKDVSNRIFFLCETSINGWDMEMHPGITYKAFYTALIHSQETNLSPEIYHTLLKGNYSKSDIELMIQDLRSQNSELLKLQSALKILFIQHNISWPQPPPGQ